MGSRGIEWERINEVNLCRLGIGIHDNCTWLEYLPITALKTG